MVEKAGKVIALGGEKLLCKEKIIIGCHVDDSGGIELHDSGVLVRIPALGHGLDLGEHITCLSLINGSYHYALFLTGGFIEFLHKGIGCLPEKTAV